MKCPTHNLTLLAKNTKFGVRRACPKPGCTVVLWEGSTSTPADLPTRQARKACHGLFDFKWRSPKGSIHRTFSNRKAAYEWLARTMGKEPSDAHIGMFTLAECEKLRDILVRLPIGEKP